MVRGKKRSKHLAALFHNSNGLGYYSFYWVEHYSGSYEVNAFKKSFRYWKSLLGANKLSIQNASFLCLSYYCPFSMLNIKWDHVFIKFAKKPLLLLSDIPVPQRMCCGQEWKQQHVQFYVWQNFSGFFIAFFVCVFQVSVLQNAFLYAYSIFITIISP